MQQKQRSYLVLDVKIRRKQGKQKFVMQQKFIPSLNYTHSRSHGRSRAEYATCNKTYTAGLGLCQVIHINKGIVIYRLNFREAL